MAFGNRGVDGSVNGIISPFMLNRECNYSTVECRVLHRVTLKTSDSFSGRVVVGEVGSSLTGSLNGLISEAITVIRGCFNNALPTSERPRRVSGRLVGAILTLHNGASRCLSLARLGGTLTRVFGIVSETGGCVSRAAP